MHIIKRVSSIIAVFLFVFPSFVSAGPFQSVEPEPAYNFALKNETDELFTLKSFQGKVVVLNFWATWCPPCRKEMPSMQSASEYLKQKGVVFVAVNVGESATKVFEFMTANGLSFPVLLDEKGETAEKFMVAGLPTTYIISKKGLITHRILGEIKWDEKDALKELERMAAQSK